MAVQSESTALEKQQMQKAFINAANGIKLFFKIERNGKIQAVVAVFVLIAGAYMHLSSVEWIAVLLCICCVLVLEMINSAIEKICDMIHPQYHPTIKIIKDVAAGAVLLASIVSVVIACFIFIPKIFF